MRRLLIWGVVVVASALPVVTLSAAMVWFLPPPTQVMAILSRAVGQTERTLSGSAPGPALERRRRGRGARPQADQVEAGPTSITVHATPTADRSLLMEVYPARDANAAVARRAVVILHGPDWPAVDRGAGAQASAWLASQGFHVFDVLAQQGGDGAVEDARTTVKCTVGWIKHNARARLGHFGVNVDPRRVALLGRRDAGALAVASAMSTTDTPWAELCAGGDPAVDAAISFYGASDVISRGGQHLHPGAPALLIIRGADGGPVKDRFGDRFGDVLRGPGGHGKAGPQGVFLREVELPLGRAGFDLVFGARGEDRAEAAVVRFLGEVDERRL
jgi:hypothetical protein